MMLFGQSLYYSSLAVVSILAPAVSWLGEWEVRMKESRRGKVKGGEIHGENPTYFCSYIQGETE